MTTPSRIYGLSAVAQSAIAGDQTTGISAAGTTQATATALTTDINTISTCAAGAGVILPVGELSKSVTVVNNGANNLAVYPPVGGALGLLATNIASFVSPGQSMTYTYSTTLNAGYVGNAPLPITQLVSIAVASGTLAAGNMEGSAICVLTQSGATALTTRTATQMYASVPNAVPGFSWFVRIINTNGSTLTLTMDASVTATGTLTLATNTFRDFLLTFTSATAATMKQIGTGSTS